MLCMLMTMVDSPEDKRKIEKLYEKYDSLMFHVARKILTVNEDVEDAVFSAWERIIKNIDKISEIECKETKNFIVIITERIHVPIPGMSIYSLLLILLAAIIYSLMVYYFDSLWIPILAHTTWNFMQNIILGLPNSGMVFPVSMFKLDAQAKNFAYDPIFGIEGTLLAVIVYVIVCAGILYFGKKRGPKETNIWSDEKE